MRVRPDMHERFRDEVTGAVSGGFRGEGRRRADEMNNRCSVIRSLPCGIGGS